MIRVSDLIEAYKQFMAVHVEPVTENEAASILFQTDWLRVLMVRKDSTLDIISIDTEISFPVEINFDLSDDTSDAFLRNLVLKTIKRFEYLLTLADHGYRLGIIGESCLWTASKDFAHAPTSADFEALLDFQNSS